MATRYEVQVERAGQWEPLLAQGQPVRRDSSTEAQIAGLDYEFLYAVRTRVRPVAVVEEDGEG